jgi:hypothetical protein
LQKTFEREDGMQVRRFAALWCDVRVHTGIPSSCEVQTARKQSWDIGRAVAGEMDASWRWRADRREQICFGGFAFFSFSACFLPHFEKHSTMAMRVRFLAVAHYYRFFFCFSDPFLVSSLCMTK